MPKWGRRTVRNSERFELLAKILEENKLRLFGNVLPHVAVVTFNSCERDNNPENLHLGIPGL